MELYKVSELKLKGVKKFLSLYFKNKVYHKYHQDYPNFVFFINDDNNLIMVYDGNTKKVYVDIKLSYDYGNKLNLHPNDFYVIQRKWIEDNFIEPIKEITPLSVQQHMEWSRLFKGE
jgi:hypothetical protein